MKSLFKNQGPFEISKVLNVCKFLEDEQLVYNGKVSNISNLTDAKKKDIVFLDSQKYLSDLNSSEASYCLIKKKYLSYIKKNTNIRPILSTEPLLDFILISKLFYPDSVSDKFNFKQNMKYKKFIKQNTFIDISAKIGKNFIIENNSFIKNNVIIGDNVFIGSNCTIANAIIGNNVVINHGSVIGKIGFGFKEFDKKTSFIPHIGSVKIEDGVYIGSNCTIDRGSFSNTVIRKNSMIDNQVHIAHNVKIGYSTIIAGQVGIAGSTEIGNYCMIGGQSGISGHLKIGDNVQIGGGSGVLRNLSDNQKVMGYPATCIKNFLNLKKRKLNDR